jgi:hypothetical protein
MSDRAVYARWEDSCAAILDASEDPPDHIDAVWSNFRREERPVIPEKQFPSDLEHRRGSAISPASHGWRRCLYVGSRTVYPSGRRRLGEWALASTRRAAQRTHSPLAARAARRAIGAAHARPAGAPRAATQAATGRSGSDAALATSLARRATATHRPKFAKSDGRSLFAPRGHR